MLVYRNFTVSLGYINNTPTMSFFLRQCIPRYKLSGLTKERRFSSAVAAIDAPAAADAQVEKRSDRRPPRRFRDELVIRHVYPEFLPDPTVQWRNPIREKLERMDMISRRTVIDLPEFYVGSVLSVTYADPHNQGNPNKFVGICIERRLCGLRAEFILRNVVDHQGVEIRFQLYDPTIQKIQVLRLEKRLDDRLCYLRDAPAEYSTFSFDMEPEILPEGVAVPVNPLIVPLKSRPWNERWERQELKGLENLDKHITSKMMLQREKHKKPWLKYDLMKTYRSTIPEEQQSEIWSEVYSQLHQMEIQRKKQARKRSIVAPKKTG